MVTCACPEPAPATLIATGPPTFKVDGLVEPPHPTAAIKSSPTPASNPVMRNRLVIVAFRLSSHGHSSARHRMSTTAFRKAPLGGTAPAGFPPPVGTIWPVELTRMALISRLLPLPLYPTM